MCGWLIVLLVGLFCVVGGFWWFVLFGWLVGFVLLFGLFVCLFVWFGLFVCLVWLVWFVWSVWFGFFGFFSLHYSNTLSNIIHDGWMEEKRERRPLGPGSGTQALPFFFHPSIMDGGHPSIIAGRPSIHHSRPAIHPSWMILDRVLK